MKVKTQKYRLVKKFNQNLPRKVPKLNGDVCMYNWLQWHWLF